MSIYYENGFPVGGWLMEQEHRHALEASSLDLTALFEANIETPSEIDPRGVFADNDPRPDVTVEAQGNQGSCQGHALTSVGEWCYFIATQGQRIEFSRAYGYYGSQKIDGINGDRGSTLDAGRKLATQYGLPEEKHWPYPDRYNPTPPGGWQQQYQYAAGNKIQSHTVLKSSREVKEYLAKGIGGVEIGISWGGQVNGQGVFNWRPGGGGHALCFLGYKTMNGTLYFWMLNSWGERWGMGGWALVAEQTVSQMFSDRFTVMIGLSDMSAPQPRGWDFVKNSTYW